MDAILEQKIDAFIAENQEQLLKDLADLVAIDSVETAPQEGAPFGPGARAALDKTLEIAAGMGLATRNCENYLGYAELPGSDPEKYLAAICHVDVVPAGNGWTADPFTMRVQDGWLLGRGVSDDKGPMIVTLYALKFLKEQGCALRYPIRALIGDNEETGMRDVEYYLAHYPAPVFCFTPDAEFPVCNGEKGHFGAKLVSPVCGGLIRDFVGGVANNAVPDRASALVAVDIAGLKNAPNITLEPEDGGVRIRGWGKSGHAASPAGTVNAIGLVVDYLLANGLCNDAERAYLEALQKLHCSTAGEGLGIACADGPFGPLTVIGGRIYMEEGRIVQTMDSRFPTCTDGAAMAAKIAAAVGSGAELVDVYANEPFYIEADSPAIRACIDTYNEVTGENATPFTMGGGTYARHFPYAVSFGPEHNDVQLPPFGGPMHGANEAAPLDKLLEALKIYVLALLRLEEIEF
ncbi:MAG: Sapep family Mn(2+)-dependent dipeptidase [Faecalibacterium sp.]